GAAEDVPVVPTGAAVGVVHRDAGGRVGDGRDVGHGAPRAPGVVLPRRLADVRRAAAARAGPRGLSAAGPVAVEHEVGPADGGDVPGGGRELRAIAAVTRAHRDGDSRVVVRRLVGR